MSDKEMGIQDGTLLGPGNGFKLYVMMDGDSHIATNPSMQEALDTLSRRGFQVDVGIAEEVVTQPDLLKVTHDLYVLKSNTELSLSLAGILHSQGARMINPYTSCAAVQDKILTSRLLRGAGIPVPASWVTGKLTLMWRIADKLPLVIKPYRGHRGSGVRLVQTVDELSALPQPGSPVLIQEFVEGKGEDLKVYVVGEEVFAVRKQSPNLEFYPQEERHSQPGRPCEVNQEVRAIAIRCGQVLGLGLYGLDVIETADGPRVVDVNAFPSYRGVSKVAPLIADYITGYAHQQVELSPLGPGKLPETGPGSTGRINDGSIVPLPL